MSTKQQEERIVYMYCVSDVEGWCAAPAQNAGRGQVNNPEGMPTARALQRSDPGGDTPKYLRKWYYSVIISSTFSTTSSTLGLLM